MRDAIEALIDMVKFFLYVLLVIVGGCIALAIGITVMLKILGLFFPDFR